MIDFISSWTRGIIIAVIVGTIIEMLLPNGNSKKYIKVIIGVYVLFSIVSPIINKVSFGKIDVAKIIDIETYSKEINNYNSLSDDISKDNNENIKEIYVNSLKKDIKAKIKEKEYEVLNINIEVENDEEYTIKNMELSVEKNNSNKKELGEEEKETNIETVNVQEVEEINVKVSKEQEKVKKSKISEKEKKEIKEFLINTYNIKEEYISIN